MPTIAAPSGLVLISATGNAISFIWLNNQYSSSPLVDLVQVFRDGALLYEGGGYPTSYTDSGLPDGTPHTYQIRAKQAWADGSNILYSAFSNSLSACTTLAKPTGLHISSTPTTATLGWTINSQHQNGFKIYRTQAGGSTFSLLATVGAGVTSFSDSGLTAAQWYKYYVVAYNASIQSDASQVISAFTSDPPNSPSKLTATAQAMDKILLVLQDNADNETGFHIYRSLDGVTYSLFATVPTPNLANYLATGLTSNTHYWWYVTAYNVSGDSSPSNAANATTFAAIAQPTSLAISAFKIGGILGAEVIFTDNSTGETDHRVERRSYVNPANLITNSGFDSDTSGWTAGNGTLAAVAGGYGGGNCLQITMVSGTYQYAYQSVTLVVGKTYLLSGWVKSGTAGNKTYKLYDNWAGGGSYSSPLITGTSSSSWVYFSATYVATATTGSIHVLKDGSDSGTMLFDSVSLQEYSAFAEIMILYPNCTYYFDTGVTAGNAYDYRVRARQSGSPDVYSAYSDIVSITVPNVPAAPTNPAVSDYQDTFLHLTWTLTSGEGGYEIWMAPHGGSFSLYGTVSAGVSYRKVSGLSPATAYDFKVRAINAAGNSAYTSVVTQTTRASYLRSRFEKLQMEQDPQLIHLVEGNPTLDLVGWNLAAGRTYTYQNILNEPRAINIDSVVENGQALAVQTSIANVEATAGSFYYDYANQIVYVHPSGSDNPINYFYIGTFWLYFTMGDPRDSSVKNSVVFNGHFYYPLVASDGIPDITQTIEPYYKGSFTKSWGNLQLLNGVSPAWGDVGFFDQISERYNWKNRKARTLLGGVDFSYSDFFAVATGVITKKSTADDRFTLSLSDYRSTLKCSLPKAVYSTDVFPNLDTNIKAGTPRPSHWGPITGFTCPQIDTTRRVFEPQNGRLTSFANFYQNGNALNAGTDYFIDYQRGWITLARGLTYSASDIMTADFTGQPDGMGNAIQIGPLMFLDLLTRFMGVPLSDCNLDSIYDSAQIATTTLFMSLYKTRTTDEIIELYEKSCMAYSFQDNLGRLGFQVAQTAASSGAIYIPECRVSNFLKSDPDDNSYSGIDLGYNEGFDGNYTILQRFANVNIWRDGANTQLPINTAIPAATDAAALVNNILLELNKPVITFDVDRALYTVQVGDLIYFTRTRYPSASGTAANLLLRIMEAVKAQAGGITDITAQEVIWPE